MKIHDAKFLKLLYTTYCRRLVTGSDARRALRETVIVVSVDALGIFLDINDTTIELRDGRLHIHEVSPGDEALRTCDLPALASDTFQFLIDHRCYINGSEIGAPPGWYVCKQLLDEESNTA